MPAWPNLCEGPSNMPKMVCHNDPKESLWILSEGDRFCPLGRKRVGSSDRDIQLQGSHVLSHRHQRLFISLSLPLSCFSSLCVSLSGCTKSRTRILMVSVSKFLLSLFLGLWLSWGLQKVFGENKFVRDEEQGY